MKTADKIRQIYERRPYPFGDYKALRRGAWSLSVEWAEAVAGISALDGAPLRVLVAGCGDGSEAFGLQRRLPDATIVAVDFSRRSIAIARRLQRREKAMSAIRFVAADLTDPRLPRILGGAFDLILCHGVLSYVPGTERAMANFSRCLKPSGALYLGVNGSSHASVRLRRALPQLGYDMNLFRDGPLLRSALRLCDSVTAADGLPSVSGKSPGFLAGDIFGALNKCLPLAQWVSFAGRAGLHFRGSWNSLRLFRRIAEHECHDRLIPMSRAQVGDFLERLSPGQFLRLLFSKTPESNPPWENRGRLMGWRIARTRLYKIRLPKRGRKVLDRLRPVTIEGRVLNLRMGWKMPEWEVELLRRADGAHSLASLLGRIPLAVPPPELRKQLYLLHQLCVISLLPPAGGK